MGVYDWLIFYEMLFLFIVVSSYFYSYYVVLYDIEYYVWYISSSFISSVYLG